jgi:hypothetical protein
VSNEQQRAEALNHAVSLAVHSGFGTADITAAQIVANADRFAEFLAGDSGD